MERELLIHLSWSIYIPPQESVPLALGLSSSLLQLTGLGPLPSSPRLLQRAQVFWQRHEATAARRWKDDGAPDVQALLGPNLFCVASLA